MTWSREWTPAALLILAFLVVMIAAAYRPSLYTTAITIGIYSLIALPLGLIYGQGGTISLAQGAFAALGSYTTAILTGRYGLPPLLTILPSMIVPAVLAFLIARPILRLPELSLALVTLSLGTVIEVALQRGGSFTGSFVGLSGIPPLPFVGQNPILVNIAIWIFVLLAVVMYSQFRQSARGRALNAIRVDRLLAEAMGVSVAFDLAVLFAIAAGVAGLAGWFYAHFIGYIAPDSLSVALSANILFMVVVGGRKAVLGPIVGAAFFTFASDILPGTETQGLFFGILLILVLMLLPDGLLSLQAVRGLSRFVPAGVRGARSAGTSVQLGEGAS
jgi:branched-chain amino acid transport system permease protein